jgi:3-isopropylmalate/(R)-2-methylmalate dehydratase small subunit
VILRGKVWKVGANMKAGGDITPTEYDHLASAGKFAELAMHLFETVLPDFAANVRKGDLVIAGANFGAGHPHFLMSSIRALVASGLAGCIAESFAGAYQRRAINAGLAAIEAPGISAVVESGDELEIDLSSGAARNITRAAELKVNPFPPMIVELLEAGGLEPYAVRKLRPST